MALYGPRINSAALRDCQVFISHKIADVLACDAQLGCFLSQGSGGFQPATNINGALNSAAP